MKFIAILKDSFREAVDAKAFYLMVALSLLLVLATFSLGFKPAPNSAEDFIKERVLITAGIDFKEVNFNEFKKVILSDRPEDVGEDTLKKVLQKHVRDGGDPRLVSIEQLDAKEKDSPDSRYKLIVGVNYFRAERAEELRRNPAEAERLMKEQFGRQGEARLVETKKVKYLPPGSPDLPKNLQTQNFQTETNTPIGAVAASSTGSRPPQNEVFYEIEVGPTSQTRVMWKHELSVVFGWFTLPFAAPLGEWIFILEDFVVGDLGSWVTLIISIILTSFFIPNMLRKGTIDLLIVKPINRWSLLMMKYIGGLTFIFLNTTLAVVGTWVALGLKTDVWATGFLLTIPMITFLFAILYSVSTLLAVLTRSAIACILLTIGVWFILFIVGFLYRGVDRYTQIETARAQARGETVEEGNFIKTIKVLHRILPRTNDLGVLVQQQLRKDLMPDQDEIIRKLDMDAKQISWGESISVSAIFVFIMLLLACWIFSIKDY